jgi:predicted nucleic acid-binding protein
MKEFFDTSVLIAAFWGGHVHHPASVTRLGAAIKNSPPAAFILCPKSMP